MKNFAFGKKDARLQTVLLARLKRRRSSRNPFSRKSGKCVEGANKLENTPGSHARLTLFTRGGCLLC
jgi:hypothetical protein